MYDIHQVYVIHQDLHLGGRGSFFLDVVTLVVNASSMTEHSASVTVQGTASEPGRQRLPYTIVRKVNQATLFLLGAP